MPSRKFRMHISEHSRQQLKHIFQILQLLFCSAAKNVQQNYMRYLILIEFI